MIARMPLASPVLHASPDPRPAICVASPMTRRLGMVVACLGLGLAACGGAGKKAATTPDKAAKKSASDFGDPADSVNGNGVGRAPGDTPGGEPSARGRSGGGGDAADASQPGRAGGPDVAATPAVSMPNYDPDPAQARASVEQHLQIARTALSTSIPDADMALREARLALEIDAASVDAAAMVALAYYHKRLYDTAELVLDDLFKREVAKQNASVYYAYGLVYDRTNRPEQAVLSYRKAVELNPGHTSALINLGVHQLQNSQYAEALQTFDRLVRQFGKGDAVTLTSLGSAYRGRAADYPAASPEHDDNVRRAEAAYKRALQASNSYGPAYYNLGLLYLDNDPFPGVPDTLLRLNAAKGYFEQYKNMPGVDMKLYDDRMKDVTKAIKRVEKQQKKGKSAPAAAPAATKPKPGAKR